MKRIQWWLLLLGSLAGWPLAAEAGPLPGAGIYTILLLDEDFRFLVRIEQPFVFGGPDTIVVNDLDSLGSGVLSFDPDPFGGYDFSFQNTTSGPIQGVVVLDFAVVPITGGTPARSQIEIVYSDAGGGGLDNQAQQTAFLTENVGPGQETFLPALDLNQTITTATPIINAAGPTPLPAPATGQYDALAVQFSFDLEPGDTATFQGSVTVGAPEPGGGALAAAALAALVVVGRRRTLRRRQESGPRRSSGPRSCRSTDEKRLSPRGMAL